MNIDKQREIDALRERARVLELEIESEESTSWRPTGFYGAYYATTGFLLGIFGAMTSLLANVIAAPIVGKSPLELIRVYLTFPLGEKALSLTAGPGNAYAVPDGLIVAFGCCLYLATGMLIGVPFQLALARVAGDGPLGRRLVLASLLALVIWGVGFYGVLSWLQPLLFGGNWITDPSVLPWWVAAVTHLIYGWTMAAVYPLGKYAPPQPAEPAAGSVRV